MTAEKSAKRKVSDFTAAVAKKMGHVSTNRKIVGAAAIGAVVGAGAVSIGMGMQSARKSNKTPEA